MKGNPADISIDGGPALPVAWLMRDPIIDAETLRLRIAEYFWMERRGAAPERLAPLRRHIVRRAWDLAPDDQRVVAILPPDWLADGHPFRQVPGVFNLACGCGKWQSHHIHTGNRVTCTCDQCINSPASPASGAASTG